MDFGKFSIVLEKTPDLRAISLLLFLAIRRSAGNCPDHTFQVIHMGHIEEFLTTA